MSEATSTAPTAEELSEDLDLPIEALEPIQTNAYCSIWRATVDGAPKLVKKYFGDDPTLVREEARGVDYYHTLASRDDRLLDASTVRLNEERNAICIDWVPGECSSALVYRGKRDTAARSEALQLGRVLGDVLGRIRDETLAHGEEPSPFLFEYIRYTSARLREHPVLGRVLFGDAVDTCEEICAEYLASGEPPSFIHGDLVFRNVHVHEGRVGLIDFANTNWRSHTLNDLFNLRITTRSMMLGREYTQDLIAAVEEGLGDREFSPVARRFYSEYHRRRWLMLKIYSGTPRGWLQAGVGLCGFARQGERPT